MFIILNININTKWVLKVTEVSQISVDQSEWGEDFMEVAFCVWKKIEDAIINFYVMAFQNRNLIFCSFNSIFFFTFIPFC